MRSGRDTRGQTEKRPCEGTHPAGSLIWNVQPPELRETHFCYIETAQSMVLVLVARANEHTFQLPEWIPEQDMYAKYVRETP